MLSIIIPVYKEKNHISRTLAALCETSFALDHEILVVDGEPKASTLSRLKAIKIHHKGIRLITSARGRGIQMNAGAKKAKGDLFLFLHADTLPDQTGMEKMLHAWQASPSPLFCGAFDLAIDSAAPLYRIIEKTASMRSRLTRVPYGDQGIFISRTLFEKAGRFPDLPLMEDVKLMSAVKQMGIKPVFLDHPILTSARRWETKGIFRTTLSNWIFISLYLLGVSPKKLAKWYYS